MWLAPSGKLGQRSSTGKNSYMTFSHQFLPSVLQAKEVEVGYPTWALVICISPIVLAMLPVPVIFFLRFFNIIDNSSGNSAVSYKKGRIIKEIPQPEEEGCSLIQGKSPSEAPSPTTASAIYRQGNSDRPDVETASNGCYGIDYSMADTPDVPELD